jgi:hypothetical protein
VFRKLLVGVVFLLLAETSAFSAETMKEQEFDLSSGHVGVELDMMPGGPLNGSMLPFITYETDKLIFSLGGNYYQFSDKYQGGTNFWQGEARANYRLNFVPNTFIDVGVDYSWQWGSQNGNSLGKNYSTGPMIGISRQFPHTNVLISVFVVAVQYVCIEAPDAQQSGQGWGYFENGGVGIRYLF